MSLPLSREVGSVMRKAKEIAGGPQERMSTAHVLLALFEVPNQASTILNDRAITAGRMQREMEGLESESGHILEKVYDRSERLAQGSRSEAVTSLHLLGALVRETSSQAYGILERCGADIGAIRTAVMSYATASRPVQKRLHSVELAQMREATKHTPRRVHERERDVPTPIGFHPSLGVGRKSSRAKIAPPEPEIDEVEEVLPEEKTAPRRALKRPFRAPKERPEPANEQETPKREERNGRGGINPLRETGGGLALDNHPGINRGGKPRRRKTRAAMEAERQAEANEDARRTTQDLAQRLFSKIKKEKVGDEIPPAGEEKLIEAEEPRVSKPKVPKKPLRKANPLLAERYKLDEEDYPYLVEFGRNLTVEAAMGRIDAVIGRDAEIAQMIDILGKRRSNNPLLVGEPGVGKTAIVEGLALRMAEMAQQGQSFGNRRVIELEMGRLLSGTHLRGAFSERLLGLKDEVAAAEGEVIVFLDEIHTWMSAGASGDGGDAAGELKTALARGKFPCIGATTHDEYRKFIESDSAFERRFQRVTVDEPDEGTALRIVEGVRTHYERHHGVHFSPDALAAAVSMSVRYIHDRQLPDKAIGVLDLAGSRASRQGIGEVDRHSIAEVVADMAGIPAERLTGSEGARFLDMESFLAKGVVGHKKIVTAIAELLRRNYAGFRSHRPIGSLLFLGPTGVGKTEMVKVLADFLFHKRDAIVRLDMSEFMEAHSVSRLIGAPPGYVGHDKGGQLTEAIRKRPYQVVLLDEIEKAHPDVLNLLLQLFDEGRLTDGRGRMVDFSNAVVVMTSNLGSAVFENESRSSSGRIGFSKWTGDGDAAGKDDALSDEVLVAAKKHFTPELWNRIDERLVFLPLSREEVAQIARLQLADSQRRLLDESAIEMDYGPALIEFLISNGGYDRKLGARPMRQTIQRLVEGAVARQILAGGVTDGGTVRVDVEDGEIVVFCG